MAIIITIAISANHVFAEQKRSYRAKSEFIKANPCPSIEINKASAKCPGYIVDHIKPLACGGDDAPHNMQWQTIDEAKAKDKWERKGC